MKQVKTKRPPLYMLREIADMFGIKESALKSMLQVAAKRKEWAPPVHIKAGGTGNLTVSPRRNYYAKADFVKFLNKEKENETTHTT